MLAQFKTKVDAFITNEQKRFRHWEHYGFVSYAACETFELHRIIYYCSVLLLVTGLGVMAYEVFLDN